MKYNKSKPENSQILENVDYRKCCFAILNQESSFFEENSQRVYLRPGNITSHTGRLGAPLTELCVWFILLHSLILYTSQTQNISKKKSKKSIACFPNNGGCWCQRKASLPFRFKTSVDPEQCNEEHIYNFLEMSFPEQVNFNRG